MIAPESNDGKGLQAAIGQSPVDHGFVSEIILLPNFGQAVAQLRGKIATVVNSVGPVLKSTGFLSPPAPRGLERPGRLFRVRFNPPTILGPALPPALFSFPMAHVPKADWIVFDHVGGALLEAGGHLNPTAFLSVASQGCGQGVIRTIQIGASATYAQYDVSLGCSSASPALPGKPDSGPLEQTS